MAYLLDTHLLIWWWEDSAHLSAKTRQLIGEQTSVVFVSAASVWEIAIKKTLGKLEMTADIEQVIQKSKFQPLPITLHHAVLAGRLPRHHDDPFDRMLVAQAQHEGLTLLTHDRRLKTYGSHVSVI